MEVENKVQLTNIAKILIQSLDKLVDNFESDEFVVFSVNASYKIKACIATVDNLRITPIHKIAKLRCPRQDDGRDFFDNLCPIFLTKGGIPFC